MVSRRVFGMIILAWLVSVLSARAQETARGGIRGSVYDKDLEAPLANCRVTVSETLLHVTTTEEGLFTFPQVPTGTYTLTFFKDGYLRYVVPNVIVQPGELTDVRAELSAEVVDMEEFVVRGFELGAGTEQGLLTIRQDASSLQDAISSELISRAGASTAAAALKLVVGTSVVDGKYVVVRGLADRYTTTLLNGVRLPTADADKRAVQLDQFPSSSIESITVNKTFTPDQQGDSTGGSVIIKTKSIPDKTVFSVSGSIEYNTQTTGNDHFLTYRGGGVSPFGIDSGGRAIPFPADRLIGLPNPSNQIPDHNEAQLLDAMTKSFIPVMGTSRKTADPNYSWGVTAGDKWAVGDEGKIGVLGSFSYRQKYSFYENALRQTVGATVGGAPLSVDRTFTDTRGVDEVLWGALGILGWQINPDHELSLTLAHNQTTTDQARLLIDSADPTDVRVNQSLRYNERTVDSLQLHGTHQFAQWDDLHVDWLAAHSSSTQNEPDQRFFRETIDTTTGFHALPGSNFTDVPTRIFRNIEETSDQLALNVKVPFQQWSGQSGYFKFGPFFDFTDRQFQQDSFRYTFASGGNSAFQQYFGSGYWADVFLDPGRVGLDPSDPTSRQLLWYIDHTNVDVDYKGKQDILAGYAMIELPITSKLKLNGGVRLEATSLNVKLDSATDLVQVVRRTPGGPVEIVNVTEEEGSGEISQLDFLPVAGATFQVITNLNVRFSYSQTIARPTFRELAPIRTFEFLGDDVFVGNNELEMSHIDNYDVRVEWFRRPGDVLAASVFYKEIDKPIERVSLALTGNRYVQTVNYPKGKLYGAEVEARQRLDVIHDLLKDFTIGANASYIISQVTLPATEAERLANIGVHTTQRPLQGQPEYIFNANLVYDNPRSGTTFGLFYTITGKSIVSGESVSDQFIPSLYELPVDNLDLSLEQKLGKNWKVTFRAKNLTDPKIQTAYQVKWNSPQVLRSSYTRGMDFSLGATYAW